MNHFDFLAACCGCRQLSSRSLIFFSTPGQSSTRFALVKVNFLRQIFAMPMTIDEIVEEASHWPPEKVGELVGRLSEDLHAGESEIEAAWKTEINRRIEEIESGKVKGVPLEDTLARARKILGR
jgi:putative addiction module component (TIGR02574 family)